MKLTETPCGAALFLTVALFLFAGTAMGQQRDNSSNLGVENWFGPLEFSGANDVYAHLTSMQRQGRPVAIKLSRSADPQRLEIAFELTADSQNQALRIIAGDSLGPIYLWTNLPNAIEDNCVSGGSMMTVIKSPDEGQSGQTIMVLNGQRRYSGSNNPCPG